MGPATADRPVSSARETSPRPRITTPFGAESTAAQVIDGIDLTGKRAVVTGAGAMGVEIARALASAGAEVTLAVRNPGPVQEIVAGGAVANAPGAVEVRPLDLTDLHSLRAFVDNWSGPLHILINNAGVTSGPEQRTPQGWELRFATNHLGHFALAVGLRDAMAAANGARIVSVSSSAHLFTPVLFDDVHFERQPYDRWLAYGQSKTANILFAVEASIRWAADGITGNALTPGIVPHERPPAVVANDPGSTSPPPGKGPMPPPKSPAQGAATTVLVATSPLLAGVGGRYFEDCNESGSHQPGTRRGVADYALDPQAAARLWQLSLDTLGSA